MSTLRTLRHRVAPIPSFAILIKCQTIAVFVPGGSWFFTVNLFDRKSRLLVDNIDALREAVRTTRRHHPFEIDAMVVLPDHIHAVWSLPDGNSDFSVRWRLIKTQLSKSIPRGEWLTPTRQARGERGIWQRRYWEHLIRDERDRAHHITYCWFNRSSTDSWQVSRIRHLSFHRDSGGSPKAHDFSDFENALAEYTGAGIAGAYGERA